MTIACGGLCVVLLHSGCLLAVDFDEYAAGASTSSGGQGGGGGGGASGGGGAAGGDGGAGAGGAGGTGGCGDLDFDNDALNCGACGVDCSGGACVGGLCTPVSMTLSGTIHAIAGLDDTVFLSVNGTMSEVVTVPLLFTSSTSPGLHRAVPDAFGQFAVGLQRAYYAAQSVAQVDACTASGLCQATAIAGVTNHVVGMAVAANRLYLGATGPDNDILSIPLTVDGALTGGSAAVEVDSMNQYGTLGVHLLVHEPVSDSLYWDTYGSGGCVYKVARSSLPLGAFAPCFSQGSAAPTGLSVSPDGVAYYSEASELFEVDPMTGAVGSFGPTDTSAPLFADLYRVFARATSAGDGLRVIDRATGLEITRLDAGPGVVMWAKSSEYLVYASGTTLTRWRKPKAP